MEEKILKKRGFLENRGKENSLHVFYSVFVGFQEDLALVYRFLVKHFRNLLRF